MKLVEQDAKLAERNATLSARDVLLLTERALRMAAKTSVQGSTGRRSAHPIQQASTGQPVPGQGRRNPIPPLLLLTSQSRMLVHKFDGHGRRHVWSGKLHKILTARG